MCLYIYINIHIYKHTHTYEQLPRTEAQVALPYDGSLTHPLVVPCSPTGAPPSTPFSNSLTPLSDCINAIMEECSKNPINTLHLRRKAFSEEIKLLERQRVSQRHFNLYRLRISISVKADRGILLAMFVDSAACRV